MMDEMDDGKKVNLCFSFWLLICKISTFLIFFFLFFIYKILLS